MLTKKDTRMLVDVMNQALEQFNKVISEHNRRIEYLELKLANEIPGGTCRFCGSIKTHVEDLGDDKPFSVVCDNCGSVGPCASTIAEAKELWTGDQSE